LGSKISQLDWKHQLRDDENSQLGEIKMDEHIYRDQLIRVITTQTPGTHFWVAKADVRYNDNKKVQFFPVEGPRDQFTTKEEAQMNIIEQARKFIDKLFVQ
jgi:hypothetical protein